MRYRTWVEYPYLSDHAPVLLQLGIGMPTVAHPFKFNPAWLREDSFVTMVREVWTDSQLQQVVGVQRRLVGKLLHLKNRVKLWSKEKCLQDKIELENLEVELAAHYNQKNQGIYNADSDQRLMFLESERKKIMLDEEERWRQKSRAIWIKSGDKNTKFFHRFASYRRNKKHIWEIKDEVGLVHTGQEALKDEATFFFNSFFQDT
jgi:hypothetical protein